MLFGMAMMRYTSWYGFIAASGDDWFSAA